MIRTAMRWLSALIAALFSAMLVALLTAMLCSFLAWAADTPDRTSSERTTT